MKSIAALIALNLVMLAIPKLVCADFTYSGEFDVADFRVSQMNIMVYDINHQTTTDGDQDVQSPGDYTTTYQDPRTHEQWTYNGHGLSRLQTFLETNAIHTAYTFDSYAGLISGSQGFQVQTEADATPSIAFQATNSGDYVLTAAGEITTMDNFGSGCSFSLSGELEDGTDNTRVDFSIANNSASLSSFSQVVSLQGGHFYYLVWLGDAMAQSPATGSPVSSEAAMIGSVDLAPVPEPATLAVLGAGVLLMLHKSRRG